MTDGKLEIFNTDQGSQFTSGDFVGLLMANRIEISMDGKGSWRDNVFVERLWRTVKYEEVYHRAYDNVAEARASLGRYFVFYNGQRPHSSHGGRTPDQAYFDNLPQAGGSMISSPMPGLIPVGRRPPSMRPGIGITRRQAIHLNPAGFCPNKPSRLLKSLLFFYHGMS